MNTGSVQTIERLYYWKERLGNLTEKLGGPSKKEEKHTTGLRLELGPLERIYLAAGAH